MKAALKRGVESGVLVQVKASYKVSAEGKKKKTAAKKAKTGKTAKDDSEEEKAVVEATEVKPKKESKKKTTEKKESKKKTTEKKETPKKVRIFKKFLSEDWNHSHSGVQLLDSGNCGEKVYSQGKKVVSVLNDAVRRGPY